MSNVKKDQRKTILSFMGTRQFQIQSMIVPWTIYIFIFAYIPMSGLIMAFQNYSIPLGILKSPWAGLQHFRYFLTDPNILMVFRNTLGMNFLGLVLGFPAPILFALVLNEVNHLQLKKVVQTVSYLPHFVSWVIFGGLVISMLSTDGGAVNQILLVLGIIKKPILFMSKPEWFWFISVMSSIIKEIGWGSILYIAAISGIDQELYDAANVDGAGRIARMRHITLPSISPTIMIMLIFSISYILSSGFDKIWMLQNNMNISTSEVFETYTYKIGIERMRFSYATAVGLFKSVVAIILLLSANFISKKVTEESLF